MMNIVAGKHQVELFCYLFLDDPADRENAADSSNLIIWVFSHGGPRGGGKDRGEPVFS